MIVAYVTLITYCVKYLGSWNSKYELIPIMVTYNLGSIAKMGYNDFNNDGKYVKVRGVQDKEEKKENEAPMEAHT